MLAVVVIALLALAGIVYAFQIIHSNGDSVPVLEPQLTVITHFKAPQMPLDERKARMDTIPPSDEIARIKGIIAVASDKYGLDEKCFTAIVRCESQFDSDVCNFRYGCGAGMGLTQLISKTVDKCSWHFGRNIDPFDENDNIECGAWIMSQDGTNDWGTETSSWGSRECWKSFCK